MIERTEPHTGKLTAGAADDFIMAQARDLQRQLDAQKRRTAELEAELAIVRGQLADAEYRDRHRSTP